MAKGPADLSGRRPTSGGGASGIGKVSRAANSQSRAARTYVTKSAPTFAQQESGRRLQAQMRDRYRSEGMKSGVKKGAKIAGPIGAVAGTVAGYAAGRSSSTSNKRSGSTAESRRSAISKAKQIKGR